MSLNVAGITAYTDEQKMPLIKKSILGGRSLEYMTVQPDIKSTATINILDSTLVAAAGSCGWTAAGSTILTQRDLSVCPIKVNESICLDTLEAYYTQAMMNPGSYNTEIPFEQLYAEDKADRINQMIDDIIWRGDTGGSGNLALCDGLLKLLSADAYADVVDGNVDAVTAITAANIIDIVDGMVSVVPEGIIESEELYLFMSHANYRTYAKALRDANLFHYTGAEDQGQKFSQMVPGTNVRVVAMTGLRTSNDMVLSTKSNLYFGTDLLNDAEDFSIFYSEDNDEVRFRAKFKMGVNVAFLGFVVLFELVV